MKKSIGSGRGSVYNILLKALQTGDKYGYEICKEIEEKSNGAYILKQPSLYSGLKRLEAQNLITSYWRDSDLGGRRHYYSLTEAGRTKIENSNFSWEDTRDNIVNSLFEKSEVENDIDDVVKQVDELKQQAESSNHLQQDINDIISSTQNLVENEELTNVNLNKEQESINQKELEPDQDLENENSTQDLFSYGNSDDLFSMFNNYNKQDLSQKDNVQDDEDDIYEEKLTPSQDLDAFETEVDKEENDDNEDYAKEIYELIDENEINEYQEENEQTDTNETSTTFNGDNEQLDLFSFVNNNSQNIEETHKQIEEQDEIDQYDDIIKNFTTYQTTDKKEDNSLNDETSQFADKELDDNQNYDNDNFDDTDAVQNLDLQENNNINEENQVFDEINEANEDSDFEQLSEYNNQLQEDIEQSNDKIQEGYDQDNINFEENNYNFIENYKNNRISSSSFVDNSKLETAEKSYFKESFEESSFDLENTTFDFSNMQDFKDTELNELAENNIQKETQNLNTVTNEQSNISETAQDSKDNSQSIDYANIFGDLMTSTNTHSNYFDDNNTAENTTKDSNSENNDLTDEKPSLYQDELPRVVLEHNDVNRTLTVDQDMIQEINEHYYEENTFEKLDNKVKEESYNQEQNTFEQYENQQYQTQQSKNLPFDKKYDNAFNNFEVPDYQVRYYKKPTIENTKASKFISINKLNFVSNIILCILICLFTTATLICSSLQVELNNIQIAYYVISFVVAIAIAISHFLKYIANKNKKAIELNKNEIIYNSFFAVVIIILAVALNILFGMNLTNILNYSATFILPLCYAVLLFINPLLKKFLSKFSSFYLN